VESRGRLGGTCLNVGCIPSKALLNASHHYTDAVNHFSKLGIEFSGLRLNLGQMLKQKDDAVDGLTKGVEGLFKKNKVDYFKGFGKITSPNTVSVTPIDGGSATTVSTANIVIATGSEPSTLPNVPVDEKRIVTSTGALSLESVPRTMAVIGGGVIGLELGSVGSRLGTQVTVIEFLDRIIPGNDSEITRLFHRTLEKQKFTFRMSTRVTKAENTGNGVNLTLAPAKGDGKEEKMTADVCLVSTGRRPFTKGLGLEGVGVAMKGLQVVTDAHFKTSVPNIYALGDVIVGPMLAHKAEEEGIAVAEILAGKPGHVNYGAIPAVIYTYPELATVGKTEDELKEKGVKYRIGKFPMAANSRARTNHDTDGMVKVIVDANTDRILGCHIVGPNAGEMIAEGVLGMEYGASSEDIARTTHAHPTFSEAFKEACMDAFAKPIHF